MTDAPRGACEWGYEGDECDNCACAVCGRDADVLALRDLWLSRLMFNVFVGWEPETRTFPEFLEAHGVR